MTTTKVSDVRDDGLKTVPCLKRELSGAECTVNCHLATNHLKKVLFRRFFGCKASKVLHLWNLLVSEKNLKTNDGLIALLIILFCHQNAEPGNHVPGHINEHCCMFSDRAFEWLPVMLGLDFNVGIPHPNSQGMWVEIDNRNSVVGLEKQTNTHIVGGINGIKWFCKGDDCHVASRNGFVCAVSPKDEGVVGFKGHNGEDVPCERVRFVTEFKLLQSCCQLLRDCCNDTSV